MIDDVEREFDERFGIGNRNSKDKRQTKKKIHVKKYSQNGKGTLYESVVLGEKSKFVYLDKAKKPQFLDEIERVNDTLVPADTIDTQNPIPFVFDSEEDFEQCFEEAKSMDLDSLFSKLETINKKYVDVEDHYHVLFIANMIWSWLQDKFGYTHYIIIVGDNGSGKNSQLLVFKHLGYRVFYVVSASAANYYTKMGNIEEGQITIAEDEAEDIAFDREKRNVFKSGYCSGGTVPKVELEGGRKSDDWLTYCQKWVAMEELPNHKEMKGILDRSFLFKFVAGDPQYNIKDVIKSAGDPKFKPLYDELTKTRKMLFCWRLLHHDDVFLDVDLNVKNRTAELTKGLVRLFANSPFALKRILDSLSKFMVERKEIRRNSFESKLYDVISELIEERKQRSKDEIKTDEDKVLAESTFTNQAIKEKCIQVMDAEEVVDKDGIKVLHADEVGTFSQTKITRVLKSKFKAKPEPKPIRIGDKTHRCIKFEPKYLKRIKSSYDIPDNVTLVTDVTLPRGILPLYSNIMNVKITAISENLLESSNKNDGHYLNEPDNNIPKETLIPPQSVATVTSVTELDTQGEGI